MRHDEHTKHTSREAMKPRTKKVRRAFDRAVRSTITEKRAAMRIYRLQEACRDLRARVDYIQQEAARIGDDIRTIYHRRVRK